MCKYVKWNAIRKMSLQLHTSLRPYTVRFKVQNRLAVDIDIVNVVIILFKEAIAIQYIVISSSHSTTNTGNTFKRPQRIDLPGFDTCCYSMVGHRA